LSVVITLVPWRYRIQTIFDLQYLWNRWSNRAIP